HGSATRPALPSFPTRRSSDLKKQLYNRGSRLSTPVPVSGSQRPAAASRRQALWLPRGAHGHVRGVHPLESPSGRLHKQSPIGSEDRKSTRLNSSHVKISYAVF